MYNEHAYYNIISNQKSGSKANGSGYTIVTKEVITGRVTAFMIIITSVYCKTIKVYGGKPWEIDNRSCTTTTLEEYFKSEE